MKVISNNKLSEILDVNKIKAVNNKINEAHGLPNECYTDINYLNFEREKVFSNNWTVIGSASSIREIGPSSAPTPSTRHRPVPLTR